jgi:hypothetical protein
MLAAAGGLVILGALARGESAIACPEGTSRAEAEPPAGREQWCERLDRSGTRTRHGPYRASYPDGRPKIQGQFVEGRKAGRWTFWYGNGILFGSGVKREEGEFQNGKEHGLWSRWYDFNVKWEEGEYREGLRDGTWTSWYPVGAKAREGDYRGDREVGVWRSWSPRGEECSPEDHGAPEHAIVDPEGLAAVDREGVS